MAGKDNNELFEEGKSVFCVDEETYSQHLTKRKEYQVSQIGTGTKSGKIRIKGDLNRLVWISDLHFSRVLQPLVKKVNIDDEIGDSHNDCVEITVTFENGKRGWFTAMTPEYLTGRLSVYKSWTAGDHTLFLLEISKEKIVEAIDELDKSNKLLDLLIPYD